VCLATSLTLLVPLPIAIDMPTPDSISRSLSESPKAITWLISNPYSLPTRSIPCNFEVLALMISAA